MNNLIITKFITKEVESIYQRYNSLSNDEVNLIVSFIKTVEENQLDFDVYSNYDVTKDIAKDLSGVSNVDIVRLYIFLNVNRNQNITVEEIKDIYKNLEYNGYMEIDFCYIYYKNRYEMIKQVVRDELYSKLEDSYELTAMFTDEELANMWIDGTSKEEVAKQYLLDNNWWEVLECEGPKEAYTDSTGNEICFCEFER